MSNTKGKILRIILGPVMFKTRFLTFLETNSNTLNNFILAVDNYELYEPYKEKVDILDIEKYRETHSWSKKYEWLNYEKNEKEYIKNWEDLHDRFKNRSLTVDFLRFGFIEEIKKGTKKILYQGANCITTNSQEKIDAIFDNMPVGHFTVPLYNLDYVDHFIGIIEEIKFDLEKEFPDIEFPKSRVYNDGNIIGFSFKSIEDGILFYKIWDTILRLMYEKNLQSLIMTKANYTQFEICLGYVIKIFQTNFNYTVDGDFKGAVHNSISPISFIHDSFYIDTNNMRFVDTYGFFVNDKMESVEDFIKENKESLESYSKAYSFSIDYEMRNDRIVYKLKE